MIGAASAWVPWALGLMCALCACDRSDEATTSAQAAGSSAASRPSAAPQASAVDGATAAAVEADDRDVRWLLRPQLRGAPLGASTARGKEVPIPHLPGSRVAQALPLADDETASEAQSSEVPLVGTANAL